MKQKQSHHHCLLSLHYQDHRRGQADKFHLPEEKPFFILIRTPIIYTIFSICTHCHRCRREYRRCDKRCCHFHEKLLCVHCFSFFQISSYSAKDRRIISYGLILSYFVCKMVRCQWTLYLDKRFFSILRKQDITLDYVHTMLKCIDYRAIPGDSRVKLRRAEVL